VEAKVKASSIKISPKTARKLGIRRFDAAEYLRDEADIAAYLEASLNGNPGLATLSKVLNAFGLRLSVQPMAIPQESHTLKVLGRRSDPYTARQFNCDRPLLARAECSESNVSCGVGHADDQLCQSS
jgi:phage tail protein X